MAKTQTTKGEVKMERKTWNQMTQDEQFNQVWKNIMESLCRAEVSNNENLEDNFYFFSRVDTTIRVLSVMMMKGLLQNFEPKFGLKTITYTKDGVEKTSTISTLISIKVFGINRNANDGKYRWQFERTERYMLPQGFTPDMTQRIDEDDFNRRVREEVARLMAEKIAVEDMTTAKLNHPVEA